MFDYPLPPLRFGLYSKLGLGPEATAGEINEARQELTTRLKARKQAIQSEVDKLYQGVPGLREAARELKLLEEAGTAADPKRFREVQTALARLEERARAIRSDYKTLQESLVDLEQQIHEANLMAIQNPEDRKEYDHDNPPLDLIKLADCGANPLMNRKTALRMLRAELTEFFEQAGEEVFHPSDLTRANFIGDFTHDKNLDVEHERRA